jgi:hypothetical protein
MRRRDIIIAGPYAAEIAIRQVFAPIDEALDTSMNSMADVRTMSKLCAEITDVLDAHTDDTPDKLWRAARRIERTKWESAHQWKCRMLSLNPATTPTLALGGMTAMNVDGWKVAIAIPSPSPMTIEHVPITEIVLIDADGNASLFTTKQPSLIEPINTQRFTVHADAKAWARDFARARLEHVRSAQQARRQANIPPVWHGRPPSALAIGPMNKIDWPFAELITAGEGVDVKALNRLIRRPAPRAHAHMNMRSAA